MEDQLKKFVQENRESLEQYRLDHDEVWAAIESGLNKKETGRWRNLMKVAASLLLLACAATAWYLTGNTSPAQASMGVALRDVSPEMAETELYYSTQIHEKLSIIHTSNKALAQEASAGLATLDSAYQDLMQDLRDDAHNEQVINAMIENYRFKLSLLEQMLEEIKSKDENREDYESDESRI